MFCGFHAFTLSNQSFLKLQTWFVTGECLHYSLKSRSTEAEITETELSSL